MNKTQFTSTNLLKAGYLYNRCDDLPQTSVPFNNLDILYYAFILTDKDGNLSNLHPAEKYTRRLTQIILPKARDSMRSPKIICSINSGMNLPNLLSKWDEYRIKKLIDDLIAYIDTYNFDGYDIDIEGYTQQMIKGYRIFVRLLHNELKTRGKLLTATFIAGAGGLPMFKDKNLHEFFDYVNVMTYSMDHRKGKYATAIYPSTNDKTTPGCSWKEAFSLYRHWVPKEKLFFGVDTFVEIHREVSNGDNIDLLSEPNYNQRLHKNQSFVDEFAPEDLKFDLETGVAYAKGVEKDGKTRYLAYFENKQSIDMKIDFAMEKGLRGIFYWEYGYDDERILRFLTEGE